MKVLSQRDISEMGYKNGKTTFNFYYANEELVDAIKTLQIGEGVTITGREWNGQTILNATPFNQYFEKCGSEIRVSTKNFGHGKEYLITRIK